jgi:Undecaprenyl-phosphate glucose phosphotransferase
LKKIKSLCRYKLGVDMGFKMISQHSDGMVAKRLLKGVDGIALFFIATWASMTSVFQLSESTSIRVGFFSAALAFASLFLIRAFSLYEQKNLSRPLKAILFTFSVTALSGFLAFMGSRICGLDFSTHWIIYWLLLSALHIGVTRLGVLVWTKPATQHYRQRIAIVGGGKAAEDAITTLEHSQGLDIEIIGLFDDRFDNRSPASVRKHKKLGKISELTTYARAQKIDLVIVAIPMSAEQRLLQILKRLWELPVDIRVSGQAAQLKLSPRAYTYLGDLPLLAIFDRPLNSWNQFLKDTLDRAIALVAIIVLAPVMVIVAVAVKFESKGPAIFKQKRFGYNNELIEVYKFRSMFTDMTDATATKLVTKNDPRVTKVGRIIRKTSLDELPQLFNVLTGQLSLVGPRPHATQAKAAGTLYDDVVEGYFARHKVKPGITGWAQINGWRGETDTHEKLEQRLKHDLEYIDRWSLGFDMYILAKTPLALVKSDNAY